MLAYTARRLVMTLPVLFGVATLVFALLHLVPGDPAASMLGEGASVEDVQALRTKLGLDRPLATQYRSYLAGAVRGDLGVSFRFGTPVTREIATRVPQTLLLAVSAMVVATALALPLGVVAAVFRGRAPDRLAMTLAVIGLSLPAFWLGPLLALIFGVELGILPVAGSGSWAHLVLPSLTLGFALAALLARMTRTTLLDELRELYVLAARARGASKWRAVLVHALRNSLIPVVTVMGLQFGAVLTGSIITETIFAWPGIGRLLITAINSRDYPVVQGCILWIAVIYVGVNLATDLIYGWLDPRIRYE
jgi:ABC-type dipeptide/oligopeptide/nickel transport system permease component